MRRRSLTAALAAAAIVAAAGCGGGEREKGPGAAAGVPAGTTAAAPEAAPAVSPEAARPAAGTAAAAGVATVNGVVVTEERFAAGLRDAAFGAKSASVEGRLEVLNRIIDEELGRQESAARTAAGHPVVQREIERRRRADVVAQFAREIAGKRRSFDEAAVDAAVGPIPEALTASVLLVEDGPLAVEIVRRLRAGGDLGALAAEYADRLHGEVVKRRELITRTRVTMYPAAVEAGLFSLKQGEAASFETPVGFLVAKVDVKRPLSDAEIANARSAVVQKLLEEDLRATQTGILDEMRAKYPVKKLVDGVAAHPVVPGDRIASWRAFQETPFATVGPLTLMLDELYRNYADFELIERSSERSQKEALAEVGGRAIDSALYYLAARDRGIKPSAAAEERIARELPELAFDAFTMDQALTVRREGLGKQQCGGIFDANPKRFLPQGRLKLRQVLVRREGQAQQVEARLRAGEDFAKVAREDSVDPSAEDGGELGWNTQRELEDDFGTEGAKVVMEQAAGGGRGIVTVRTTKGYHVLSLEAYRAPGEGSYEEAEERVLDACLTERRREALRDLVKQLRAKATITIDEAKVASVEPLPGRPEDGVHGKGDGRGSSPHGGGGGAPHGGMGSSPHGR